MFVELLEDREITTEIDEDKKTISSTKVSKDEKDQNFSLEENNTSISIERLSLDDTYLMKYETLHLFSRFDFVWPGAIERIKVANIRKNEMI